MAFLLLFCPIPLGQVQLGKLKEAPVVASFTKTLYCSAPFLKGSVHLGQGGEAGVQLGKEGRGGGSRSMSGT